MLTLLKWVQKIRQSCGNVWLQDPQKQLDLNIFNKLEELFGKLEDIAESLYDHATNLEIHGRKSQVVFVKQEYCQMMMTRFLPYIEWRTANETKSKSWC